MLIIDNSLYLEVSDAVECGLGKSAALIYEAKSKGAKWATFIKHPVYKNLVLLEFESLNPKKKQQVIDHFGNPYEYFARTPIRKMVSRDTKAEQFFIDYTYNDNNHLPLEIIEKYTIAASWLNMLCKAEEDKVEIKRTLGIPLAKFWLNVSEIIKTDKIDLPTHYIRLREKMQQYQANGYQVLIHKQIGNTNSKKVADELSEALLLELISMPNSDDNVTARRYNQWAVENNRQQITASTVGNWRRKHLSLISLSKYGTKENYNKFGKHIQRRRPSAPLLLVEHDDNELDLYFKSTRTKGSRTQLYYFNRFVIAVVIDAFNDYILGWAIAETYTKDLIRLAYLDAIYNINKLTGGWYLPHQIRSDRFGLDANLTNDLAQFYQCLAVYTPAAIKVARGKYIEQSFGKKWHQVLGCYTNYAGTNITSGGRISQDFIDQNKDQYPTTEQAPYQVMQFIDIMRNLVNEKTGLSKQEEWVKAFNQSEKSKAHPISEVQLLAKLGTPHTHSNTITNRGITPAINCVERTYEIPEELYLQTVGKTVQVIYDPFNYSRILVTDNKNLLFIAREQELMPSAIADFEPGDRKKINDRIEEKIRHMQSISNAKDKRIDVLERNRINTESLLMAGVHSKSINHQLLLDHVPVENIKPQKRISKERNMNDVLDGI